MKVKQATIDAINAAFEEFEREQGSHPLIVSVLRWIHGEIVNRMQVE